MGTHLSLTPKTPDKMRVLLALTLLVAGALAGGKEKREMEMWMKMKAMEGCFGEELVKDHMIKMKRSAAKCMRVEAPELELPMFENSFRFANAMSRTPRRGMGMGGKKSMMKTFMMMKMFSEMMDSGNGIQKRRGRGRLRPRLQAAREARAQEGAHGGDVRKHDLHAQGVPGARL